jgi:endonuclease YncB( thermonuclease family)
MYVKDYTAQVPAVHKISDGDTYWLWLDPGYRHRFLVHIRLDGWDTPETRKPASPYEKRMGAQATRFADDWFAVHLAAGSKIWCRTTPDPTESLDRWVGEIWAETLMGATLDLGAQMERSGLAVPDPDGDHHWWQTHDPERNKA